MNGGRAVSDRLFNAKGTLLADMLAALALAAGFTAALLCGIGLTEDIAAAAVCAAADLLLVILLARVWRTAAALLLGLTAAGLILLPFFDWWTVPAAWVRGFFRWWAYGLADATPYADSGSIVLVLLLAAMPIAAVLWWVLRRMFWFPFFAALAAVVSLALCLTGQETAPGVIALLSGGLIVLLPRVHHRLLCRNGESGISRPALQLMAVPAAVLCVGLAWLTVPQDTADWRFRPLVNLVADLGDYFSFTFGSGSAVPPFNIAVSGFQPLGDRLGGPIAPNDERVLTYSGERPVLLEGSSQDTYTGTNWTDPVGGGRFRFDSLLWGARRNQVFCLDLPANRMKTAESCFTLIQAEVRNLQTTSAIFSMGRISAIQLLGSDASQSVYFDSNGVLFSSARVSAYRMTARTAARDAPGFDGMFLQLEQDTAGRRDKHYEEIAARFLTLPGTLPQSVRDAARNMAGDGSAYTRAKNIENHLSQNFTYTLTPDIPPADGDFVEHFLDTREGYCVYFATAMAVLARCEGIPSRYVTGYGLRSDKNYAGRYAAANNTAHAWAQLYFKGIGWVPFDPLRWDAYLPEEEPDPPEPEEARISAADDARAQNMLEKESDPPAAAPPKQAGTAALLVLFVMLTLFVLATWLSRRLRERPNRLYRYERVAAMFSNAAGQMNYLYEDLLRQWSFFDLTPRLGETLSAFAARCDRRMLPPPECGMQALAVTVAAQRYGNIAPNPEEIRRMAQYHAVLEKKIAEKLGKWPYLLRRCIRVPAR